MSQTSPSHLSRALFSVGISLLLGLPAFGNSQVRIVRLSDVQGGVQIDKNTGLGFERAFVNLPITEGTQLRTGRNGRAEVEFEDGSSMRLTPDTTVEFSKLSLSDAGQRISQVNLIEGMAYVNWLGKDDLAMNFAHEKLALERSAHFRVDTSDQLANLAVFKGDVDVEGPAGKLTVEKNKSATFNADDQDKYTVAKKIEEEPLDSWDKDAVSYHNQYAKNNVSSPYGYGLSDLNYYGAFSSVPGYGMMWQPFFAGAGWDPFMDGVWGFYPGMGYMFASAYPWGWMPYRYGNWAFVPGYGWGWRPGNWNTWMPIPHYAGTGLTHVTALTPPAVGTSRTVMVGRAGVMSPMQTSGLRVTPGMAGMGIARGSLDNMRGLNHQVARSGFAQVRPAPQFAATSPNRGSFGYGRGYSGAYGRGYAGARGTMVGARGTYAGARGTMAGASRGSMAGGGMHGGMGAAGAGHAGGAVASGGGHR